MKKFKEFKKELPLVESILLGKSIQMGDRRARIIKVVSVGGTSRYDTVYKVKFQDGTQIEMHDSQIRPFLIEEGGAGEEATNELDDNYREDTPGEEATNEQEDKVVCPKCEGKGCEHCDGKGYHLDEAYGLKGLVFQFPSKRNAEQFAYDISNSGVAKGIEYQEERDWYVEVEILGNYNSVSRSAIKKYMQKNKGVFVDLAGRTSSKKLGLESVELDEAESLHWNELSVKERQDLLKNAGMSTIFSSNKRWTQLDGQIKKRLKNMIRKTTQGEYELVESAPANVVGGGMSPHFGGEGGVQGYDPILGKKKRKKFAGAEVFELTSDDYHNCMHGRKRYERWNKRLNMEDIANQEIRSYVHKNPGRAVVIQDKTTGIMAYLLHGDKK